MTVSPRSSFLTSRTSSFRTIAISASHSPVTFARKMAGNLSLLRNRTGLAPTIQ